MNALKISFMLFLLTLAYACNKNGTEIEQEIKLTEKAASLVDADNKFGLELFRNVASMADNSENLMISPLSVALALAMTYNGAEGSTKTNMEKTLKVYGLTPQEINESYKKLVDALKSVDKKVLLEIANAIYYRKDFQVEAKFISLNKNYYNSEVSPLDFNSPSAVKTINSWVEDKTNGKITTILDEITPSQVMFLLNAIYFKGLWKKEFDPRATGSFQFTADSGEKKQVPMMWRTDTLEYATNDIFSAIRLPYGKGNYSMFVFLPEAGRTLKDIEVRLDSENWESWMKEFMPSRVVDIRLPKFKFPYEIKLNDILSDMGMAVAFTGAADFTGINKSGGLKIDYVKHKSFIEVNEEGTEAAAVTIVAIDKTMAGPKKIPFYADRPFLFAITEKDTGAILFMGEVSDPSKN